jgi:hypothetical protein
VCDLPVNAARAMRVMDPSVNTSNGKPKRWLAHRGECAAELTWRLRG